MAKFGFLGILLVSIALFGSCSNNIGRKAQIEEQAPAVSEKTTPQKSYGSYLAGRVAHLRRDFNKASDYYIEALKIDPNNPELVSRLYLLLVSKGRIDEAAVYAQKAWDNGDRNSFIQVVMAVDALKQGNYSQVAPILKKTTNPVYNEFINPLLNAWAEVGMNNPDQALAQLDKLKKEPSFRALYHFHRGMINDYFNRTRDAQTDYEVIVNEEQLEMSFRALQVISNFYLRTDQKDKAVTIANKYNDEKLLAEMLAKLQKNVASAKMSNTKKIIQTPNEGAAEALFSIAATLRQGVGGIDLAHMFIAMSIYENPKYDLAKLLLADILENREMYADANDVYDTIGKDSEAYYTVQLKKANNLVLTQDYAAAELLLKSIALDSDNYQLYFNIGDILRVKNKPEEAIEYYEKALEKLSNPESQHWILYYALGVAYEQDNQWKKAENSFKKALELSDNHYMVLNYLGYSWLRRGENIDEAFTMIVNAYNQAPNDSNVNDSLGWALYNLGYYRMSINYLEKAAEADPSNAVICDHLGDAYWFNNRKNEAGFQWRHALRLKDDSKELNKDTVQKKIQEGLKQEPKLTYNQEVIEKQIRLIQKSDD